MKFNINLLKDKDFTFAGFRKVLDLRMKGLLTKGFCTDIKQADLILLEDEETIWNNGVLDLPLQNLNNTPYSFTVVNYLDSGDKMSIKLF